VAGWQGTALYLYMYVCVNRTVIVQHSASTAGAASSAEPAVYWYRAVLAQGAAEGEGYAWKQTFARRVQGHGAVQYAVCSLPSPDSSGPLDSGTVRSLARCGWCSHRRPPQDVLHTSPPHESSPPKRAGERTSRTGVVGVAAQIGSVLGFSGTNLQDAQKKNRD
jgi:hypothetical protein